MSGNEERTKAFAERYAGAAVIAASMEATYSLKPGQGDFVVKMAGSLPVPPNQPITGKIVGYHLGHDPKAHFELGDSQLVVDVSHSAPGMGITADDRREVVWTVPEADRGHSFLLRTVEQVKLV